MYKNRYKLVIYIKMYINNKNNKFYNNKFYINNKININNYNDKLV